MAIDPKDDKWHVDLSDEPIELRAEDIPAFLNAMKKAAVKEKKEAN
jgi:hypothetical protein